ncbi:hypothetical protein PAPHI01_0757 [Pancytospora philotis]|nr:hypothetical protein PAPHI01_0757 [Pancytospora philotis]
MGWGQQSSAKRTIEEELDILNNRLSSATYEEDIVDTLEEIHAYSLRAPTAVGTMCLQNVYKTLGTMQCAKAQLGIIRNVVAGELRGEFTEMIFADPGSSELLMGLQVRDIAALCDVFRSDYFFQRIAENERVGRLLMAFIDNGLAEQVGPFLRARPQLGKQLVFEGGLEKIIGRHAAHTGRESERRALEELMRVLVGSSIMVQDYFLESRLHAHAVFASPRHAQLALDVFSLLLNPLNDNFSKIQDQLLVPYFVRSAVFHKSYRFLSLLALGNPHNANTVCQQYLDLAVVAADADTSDDALALLGSIVDFVEGLAVDARSYRVNLLLVSRGLGEPLVEQALDDFRAGNVTAQLLLYALFTFDSLEDVAPLIRVSELTGLCYELAVFLLLTHRCASGLPQNHYQTLQTLRSLRERVASERLLDESSCNTLVINISDTIEELNKAHTRRMREEYEAAPKRPHVHTAAGAEKVPAAEAPVGLGVVEPENAQSGIFSRFKDSGYKTVSGALNILKKSPPSGDTYDL